MYACEMPTPQLSCHPVTSEMMSACTCINKELHYKGLKTRQKMLHPYRFIGAADPLNKIVGDPNLSHYIMHGKLIYAKYKSRGKVCHSCCTVIDVKWHKNHIQMYKSIS